LLFVFVVTMVEGCGRKDGDGTPTIRSQEADRAVAKSPLPQEWAARKRTLFDAAQHLNPGDSYERVVAMLGRPVEERVVYSQPKPPWGPITGFSASYTPGSDDHGTPIFDFRFDVNKRLAYIITDLSDMPSIRVPIIVLTDDVLGDDFVVHQGKSRKVKPGERYEDAIKLGPIADDKGRPEVRKYTQ
jgi:hypothetical protein